MSMHCITETKKRAFKSVRDSLVDCMEEHARDVELGLTFLNTYCVFEEHCRNYAATLDALQHRVNELQREITHLKVYLCAYQAQLESYRPQGAERTEFSCDMFFLAIVVNYLQHKKCGRVQANSSHIWKVGRN